MKKQLTKQHGGASPAVVLDQRLGERRNEESADAGAAHPQAVGHRQPLVEPVRDVHHRRHVSQRQTQSRDHAKGQHQNFD